MDMKKLRDYIVKPQPPYDELDRSRTVALVEMGDPAKYGWSDEMVQRVRGFQKTAQARIDTWPVLFLTGEDESTEIVNKGKLMPSMVKTEISNDTLVIAVSHSSQHTPSYVSLDITDKATKKETHITLFRSEAVELARAIGEAVDRAS